MKFKAFLVEENEGLFIRRVVEKEMEILSENEVMVKVEYSSLNYKDALSASGNKGVTKSYPHVPGIDAVGVVVDTKDENIKVGTKVIITGFDLGMNTDGGYQEYLRIPSSWVVPLPENMSQKESMIYGTAGLTAGLSVFKLIEKGGIKKEDGEVVITGATGGVGSVAVMILAKLGYQVVAVTGKLEEAEYLKSIGATRVIHRDELNDKTRPMLKGVYAGVIDTVGGNILSTALKSLKYNGVATACGNAGGASFESSVFPFILRGVTLYGIDSVQISLEERYMIWNKLANEWKIDNLEKIATEVDLNSLNAKIDDILSGVNVGRVIVKL